jgi:hypothetical protein
MLIASGIGAEAPTWLDSVGTALTGIAAITALLLVGWSERRRLVSQHRHDERRKLQELIGRFHGRLLEAAVDWDRRMHQLYVSEPAPDDWNPPPPENGMSEVAYFLDNSDREEDPEAYIHGKFLDESEYLFRSYVFRFLALCGLARRFERDAFYIDAKVGRPSDRQFLKYAKAFIWAVTNSDLHEDIIPGRDHFPNDEFRPILDSCYCSGQAPADLPRSASVAGASDGETMPVFDLVRLDALVKRDYEAHLARVGLTRNGGPEGADEHHSSPDEPLSRALETSDVPAAGIGRVILFFSGLRKDRRDEGRLRYNWDRLCVLHLFVMAFINEFGYPWQERKREHFERARYEIVDPRVCQRFASALPELGLLPHRSGEKLALAAWPEQRCVSRTPMSYVEKLMSEKGAYAREADG